MCKECVREGRMTQEELDRANNTDSDQADYSSVAEAFVSNLMSALSPQDPDTKAQAHMDTVLTEALEMAKAYVDEGTLFVPNGTDPDSPVGVAKRLGYAATQIAYFQDKNAIASMVAVLAHEVTRLNDFLETLQAASAKTDADTALHVNNLNAALDGATSEMKRYRDQVISIRNALPSDIKSVYLTEDMLNTD